MSETVSLKIKLNYQVILVMIIIAHALLLTLEKLPNFSEVSPPNISGVREETRPLNVRSIRTVGARDSKIQDSTYLSKSEVTSKQIMKDRYAPTLNESKQTVNRPAHPLSLKDFAEKPLKAQEIKKVVAAAEPVRPGSRPGVGPQERPKALEAIKLNGAKMSQFSNSSDAAAISGDPRAASLSNSDIMVKLEVPEGVSEEELNEYELMFYGFQRRTAIGYINSFYKNLDKFERENPHKQFPLTEDKQTMTGRLTFDSRGNLKQIKMVRWTNVTRLQDFFVDVLKEMDTLHNPPKQLWDRDQEFTVFFSLIINN